MKYTEQNSKIMGLLLQTSVLPVNNSFIVQTIDSSSFEKISCSTRAVNEIILFTKGSGIALIGNYAGKFEAGDVLLLGGHLPYTFHQRSNDPINAILIQFHNDCLGRAFMDLPECRQIKKLIEMAEYGLQLTGNSKSQIQLVIKEVESAINVNRVILLLQCLQIAAEGKESVTLSTRSINWNSGNDSVIEKVLQFTVNRFTEPLTLPQVATVACMSVSAFCHYFKRCTQKTYIDFLNDVRIRYACSQLLQTDKPITDVGYECGYNTIVHFHRQFLKLKGVTPLQYRKRFSDNPEVEVPQMCHQSFSWSFN